MEPAAWLQKAFDELVELGSVLEGDRADAWRAGALVARLLGSPSGPVPPPELVRRLSTILAVAGSPDAQELLDRVADELDSETDAWGPLLDALLDADDAIGLLDLSGESETALELARRVAALVSLHSERALALGPFADMRLATVREGVGAGIIWSAVERAPALALAEALPEPASTRARLERRPETHRLPVGAPAMSFAVPDELLQAAAESAPEEARELETSGGGRAWLYAEKGRMRLEVTGLAAGPLTAALVAERRSDGVELLRVALDLERSGGTAYADLGPSAGSENALHRLVAEAGLKSSDLRVRLSVADG